MEHNISSIHRLVTAGTRTPEPFLSRGSGSFWSVLFYLGSNRPDSSTPLKGDTTSRHCNTPRIIRQQDPRITGAGYFSISEKAWLPKTLTHPESQVHRSPQSKDHRESSEESWKSTGIIRMTGSNQIYWEKQALEIIRWQEASIRTEATETKVIWHHHYSKSWIHLHTRKARHGSKVTSHHDDGGL